MKGKKYRSGEEWVARMANSAIKIRMQKNITKRTRITKYISLCKVLEVGFIWFNSPEGYDFWNTVHKVLLTDKK